MSSRRIEDLHPVVQKKCRLFLRLCKEKGIDLIITSTLRTPAEQLALFSQGRKTLKAVNEFRKSAGMSPISEKENRRTVTGLLTSIHQFGCAFDCAILKPDHPPSKGIGGKAPYNPHGESALQNKDPVPAHSRKDSRVGIPIWDIKADLNNNDIPDYEEIGRIGEGIGLKWGGRFKFKDYVHFEYTGGLSIDELKEGKRPQEV